MNEGQLDNNGKVSMMGMNIDINNVIGKNIVDQFMASLNEQEISDLNDQIKGKLFSLLTIYNSDNKERQALCVKEKEHGVYRDQDTTIWASVKNKIAEKLTNDIFNKCMEIIDTDEYHKKVDSIAEQIVEYATEGYKKDMKECIYNKLVGSVANPNDISLYNNNNLKYIIQQEISRIIHQ